jgi:hypothetical protein
MCWPHEEAGTGTQRTDAGSLRTRQTPWASKQLNLQGYPRSLMSFATVLSRALAKA